MKKQTLSKLFTAAVIAATLTGNFSVMAADGTTANITVNGHAREYAAYRLLDVSPRLKGSCDHEDGSHDTTCYNYSYTINEKYASAMQETAMDMKPLLDTDKDGSISSTELTAGLCDMDADDIRTFADVLYQKIKSMDADMTTTTKVFANAGMGYYLIAETQAEGAGDAKSLVMLDTAGESDITVNAKEGVPALTKKILVPDTSAEDGYRRVDAVDVNKNQDQIQYEVEVALPDNIGQQKNFTLTLHDTTSGISLNGDRTFYVDGKEVELYRDGMPAVSDDSCVFHETIYIGGIMWCNCDALIADETIAKEHIKNHLQNGEDDGHQTIIASNLIYKDTRQPVKFQKDMKLTMRYTGTLADDFTTGASGNINEAWATFTSDPYEPSETEDTPHDKVAAFTYVVEVNKVNGSQKPLSGADFVLQRKEGDSWSTAIPYNESNSDLSSTAFTFTGLDAGEYRLTEAVVPDGYDKADDIYFTIQADYTETADNPSLTGLTVLVNGEVVSTGDNASFSVDVPNGTVTTSVVNTAGVRLPSTGELGMMVLYIGGAVLIIGGGMVLFGTRKKEV